ncbi:MAG: type II toxin-antitoxin system PemK/MazF family toxin [Anaerolineae bacterium]|nr:type II toxin-antitoxin system PemK/MazF family toxin [Anaerolineae bacterium]
MNSFQTQDEIWLVTLDPTFGAEIRKTRPVGVVSSNVVGALPIGARCQAARQVSFIVRALRRPSKVAL